MDFISDQPGNLEGFLFQVVHSSGPSGHNVEYVLKTAEWMKKNIPGIQDDHLFSIEKHVRRKIAEYKFNLRHLMGEPEEESEAESDEEVSDASEDDDEESDDSSGGSGKQGSRFSSHVCDKCLRCVKM